MTILETLEKFIDDVCQKVDFYEAALHKLGISNDVSVRYLDPKNWTDEQNYYYEQYKFWFDRMDIAISEVGKIRHHLQNDVSSVEFVTS